MEGHTTEATHKTGYGLASANQVLTSAFKRTVAGKTLDAGGFSLGVSGEASSTADYAATSQAMAKASEHIDMILKEQDLKIKTSDLSFDKYNEKVEMVPQHELREDLDPCKMPLADWELAEIAVEASAYAYEKLPSIRSQQKYKTIKKKEGMQATVAYVADWNDQRVLVFGIRGTVKMKDWALDINSGPSTQTEEQTFHRAFLRTAQAMEPEVVRIIREFWAEGSEFDSVLLAGHSLGGAISQILYHFVFNEGGLLQKALAESNSSWVNCITFGTPPVSSKPIASYPPGCFMAFANEGDLIVRAQESFILELLRIYALPVQYVQQSVQRGFVVPEPFFRLSGKCVVLRAIAGTRGSQHKAFNVDTTELEKAFFGNVYAHDSSLYVKRVKYLAESARVQEFKIGEE